MATAVNESDIFTCPICLEKLKSPKSLPCLHTFCELCIGEFILSTERRKGHKLKSYHCPVCRSVVTPTNPEDETSQWASTLPQNLSIPSQMDQSETTKQECHLCLRQNVQHVATHWCRDCSEAFCDDCLRLHNLMKISADHNVVKIEDITKCASGSETDLSMISDTCSLHKSKILDAFCFDHQELCCVHCLTLQHRKCENVQAIDMMENLNNDKMETLQFELAEVKNKMDRLAEERNLEKEKLISVFKQIETDAKNTTETIKEKLDGLLVSVIKELNLIRDQQTLDCEENSETVKTFLNRINQLQNKTNFVQQHGNLNQKFIHFERSKIELKSAVKEASRTLNSSSIRDAKFVLNETMESVVNTDCVGKMNITKKSAIDSGLYESRFYTTKSALLNKIKPPVCYDNICIQHRKTIHLPNFNVYACVHRSEKIVVLGGIEGKNPTGKIKALDISNEQILAEFTSSEEIKQLAYDVESKYLFVSCYNSKLFTLKFIDEFDSEIIIKKSSDMYNGDLCVFEGTLYVMVDSTVQNISIENIEDGYLQTCFTTKTNCTSLNGLAIDCKNRHLLHTSKEEELICTSLEGNIIFSYKDEHFKQPLGLAIHPQGIVFVGSHNGSIYIVCEDGKRMRILLKNCKKIKTINDICFNTSLAVCGADYLEIYDVIV